MMTSLQNKQTNKQGNEQTKETMFKALYSLNRKLSKILQYAIQVCFVDPVSVTGESIDGQSPKPSLGQDFTFLKGV